MFAVASFWPLHVLFLLNIESFFPKGNSSEESFSTQFFIVHYNVSTPELYKLGRMKASHNQVRLIMCTILQASRMMLKFWPMMEKFISTGPFLFVYGCQLCTLIPSLTQEHWKWKLLHITLKIIEDYKSNTFKGDLTGVIFDLNILRDPWRGLLWDLKSP